VERERGKKEGKPAATSEASKPQSRLPSPQKHFPQRTDMQTIYQVNIPLDHIVPLDGGANRIAMGVRKQKIRYFPTLGGYPPVPHPV